MEEKAKKFSFIFLIKNLDAIVTGITLVLCTVLVNVNVLMRYILKSPLYWCEEVVTGLFVWTVFIGSAYAYRTHAHLGVDILVNLIPEKAEVAVKMAIDLLEFAVLVMLTHISLQYVLNTWDKLTNTLRVPNWYISIAVPIGFGLSLIYSVFFIISNIRNVLNNRKGGKL